MTSALTAMLVVALGAEARPLVRHFGLRKDPRRLPFAVYRNESVVLIRSGVGAVAVAAAVGFAHALEAPAGDATTSARPWLNVGVAGGAELVAGVPAPLGAAVLGARVEGERGRVFYPPIVLETPLPLAVVRTVAEPERDYREPGLYEMEAAGFVEAASRLSRPELVQVLKVVSDGPDAPVEELTAAVVEERIAACTEAIAAVVDGLLELASSLPSLPPPSWREKILSGRHFTVTQRRQLERLLERLRALGGEPRLEDLAGLDAGRCLADLERQVARRPILLALGKGDGPA